LTITEIVFYDNILWQKKEEAKTQILNKLNKFIVLNMLLNVNKNFKTE